MNTATPMLGAQFSADRLLRKYAHFEDPAPIVPPAQPPAPPATEPPTDPAWLPDRLKRATAAGAEAERKKVLEELGVEDPAADAQLLKAAKAKREADKTEVERLAGETAKEKERADKLQTELDRERQQRITDRRDSAIKAKAANAHDLDAVLEWASRPANADLFKKTVGDDGLIDDKAVEALIAAARKNAAYLFKVGGVGSPPLSGGRPTQGNADAEKRAARTSQRTIRG